MSKPSYIPTPEEIKEGCRRIQAGWSKSEEWRRRTFPHLENAVSEVPPYELPIVSARALFGADERNP